MTATREAVDLYRKLAAARPDAFLPDLAGSLNNLGIRHSELGQREEAMTATREAVDIRRKLAAARPDAFLPDLATSLRHHIQWLEEAGGEPQQDEALIAAFTLLQKLQVEPDAE